MYDIILGRSAGDTKKYGKKGAVFIGKQYVQMGQTYSLSNPIYMDVSRAHAMLIVGKRGGGKSYTMGSIAEGLADMDPEVSKNLAFVLLDTMGVYWSMKYGNKKEEDFLKKWGLDSKGMDVIIYVPGGYYNKYKEDGVPVDFPLYIRPNELAVEDWMNAFKLGADDPVGVAVQMVVGRLLDSGKNFSIDDIISETESNKRLDEKTRLAVINRFENCKSWGIFSKTATSIRDILHGGKVSVLDLSPYVAMPGGWEVKALTLGIIAKKIFVERMLTRKREELFDIVNRTQVVGQDEVKDDMPMPWLIIDECLPYDSKIITNLGIIEIGKIVENYNSFENLHALGYNKETGEFEFQKISKVYDNGIRELIELKTESGKKLRCTPDHKVLDKNGFIEAKDAQYLINPLITMNYSTEKKNIIARLIGSIYGDGWMSHKQVGFSSDKDPNNLNKIKEDLKLIGFKSSNIYSRNTISSIKNHLGKSNDVIGMSYSIHSSSNAYNFFLGLEVPKGKRVNQKVLIPQWLLRSSNSEKAEFLSALMGADGNIPSQSNKWKSDYNPIRLVFYKREDLKENGLEYANQIKKLFSDLGIKISSISQRKGNIRVDNTKTIRFEITIAKELNNMIKYFDIVGYKYSKRKELEAQKWLFYLNYKKQELQNIKKIHKKVLDLRKKTGWGKIKIAKELGIADYIVREWIYYNRKPNLTWSFPSFKQWEKINCKRNIIYDPIISKKKIKSENVYDITVDKIHNFIANNSIVHNCHEFLPAGDEEAPSKQALMTILREGRQPGVSLIMATQQPAKIHTDAITQSDIVLAHRLTASFDLEALDKIFLSYDSKGSKALFNAMPRTKGCAIIMDDKNERLHTMQVKPRVTWHGGEDPNAIREVKDEFDLD